MTDLHSECILVIDFGSQVTQLIARRVREAGVYCEIVPFQSAGAAFARLAPRGVILSGGPASTSDVDSPRAPKAVFEAGVPVLGICYGQMAMSRPWAGGLKRRKPANSVAPRLKFCATTRFLTGCGRPVDNIRCGCPTVTGLSNCRPDLKFRPDPKARPWRSLLM